MTKTRLTLLVGLIATGLQARGDDLPRGHDPDCGARALFQLTELTGKSANLEAIEKALPTHNTPGHSMADLRSAAWSQGVRLRGVRFVQGGGPLDRPAIAFLALANEGHFVVLRPVGVTGTMVQVLDPPFAPRVVDYADLLASRQWTGRILVPQSAFERFVEIAWFPLIGLGFAVGLALLANRFRRPKLNAVQQANAAG